MSAAVHQKVTAAHLQRDAYLYVRQSTLRQVVENTESTKRQYDLRHRATALGWPLDRIVIIDNDLGQSGASATDRSGFQRLVAEVSMGHVGIVLGLEVSRLARSSTDWHRLLEICALTSTLILDEDGVYNPNDFNDRLLLGLKGTMSEAELHVLRARLRGGILNKARRGELKGPIPVGFVYDVHDRVVLDPDKQVQEAIHMLFRTFRRVGTATATVKAFRDQGLQFPRRLRKGPRKGELLWAPLVHSRTLQVLHNPRYAGAFFYGKSQIKRSVDGAKRSEKLPREDWHALVPDAHEGYIAWEEFEKNQCRLRENAQAYGHDRRKSPPREGPALLQGLALCGICGKRMTIRYHTRNGRQIPDYVCQREGIEHGRSSCQHIPGSGIDEAIGKLLLETVTPLALEVTLAVQEELSARVKEVETLHHKQVERAQYEVELARRRYMHVDPDNRLVANALEAEWNEKLRALDAAQQAYEERRQADNVMPDDAQRAEIVEIATDFPKVWQDPNTPDRERKRMVRLILEDVTLTKGDQVTADVRFKGGATQTLHIPLAQPSWKIWQTKEEIIQEIDVLLDHHTEAEIAEIFNKRGYKSGQGKAFTVRMIARLRRDYNLIDRFTRLREAGMLTVQEMAGELGLNPDTVKKWRRRGFLRCHSVDGHSHLFEPPTEDTPKKSAHKKVKHVR